jgi:hypothetical protein
MTAPTSQKAGVRPISFVLVDGNAGTTVSISLSIRPEDLTRTEPTTATAQRTLGGAWVDNFGPGIGNIMISGHTGWRVHGSNGDGASEFLYLRDTVFTQYHAARQAAVAAGNDPSKVKLIYSDSLDSISVSVLPMAFVLKRNRARPLLMMYQINMTVLGDDVAPESAESDGPDPASAAALGVDSLQDSLNKLTSFVQGAQRTFQADVLGPIEGVMTIANTAMSKVLGAVNTVDGLVVGVTSQLVGFAQDITQTARNAMYTYNAVVDQPDFLKANVMAIASAYDNAFCVLSNIFKTTDIWPDYSDVYGSSNCSSTAGGSPVSPITSINAFTEIVPSYQPAIAVTPLAQSNIALMNSADPVLAPMALPDMTSRLSTIASGVTFL